MSYELQPIYNPVQSFYNKAIVIEEDDAEVLLSYGTRVAKYVKSADKMIIYDYFSLTTAKHINEFLQQKGFRKATKQEMEKGIDITKN